MNQRPNSDKFWNVLSRRKNRPADNDLLGSAKIRYMLGWVISLGLLTLIVNLPIYPRQIPVGWQSIFRHDEIQMLPMPPEARDLGQADTNPVTVIAQPEQRLDQIITPDEVKQEDDASPIELVRESVRLERIDRGPILEFVDESPAIVGGLSTLYLSIDYPKSARDKGIEGLTVLVFVVEKDGTTNNIEVLKPLHPSLDSAAVAAVSNTLFKPGRQNGKIVRVKMKLPIRFRLVNPLKPNQPAKPEPVETDSVDWQ